MLGRRLRKLFGLTRLQKKHIPMEESKKEIIHLANVGGEIISITGNANILVPVNTKGLTLDELAASSNHGQIQYTQGNKN